MTENSLLSNIQKRSLATDSLVPRLNQQPIYVLRVGVFRETRALPQYKQILSIAEMMIVPAGSQKMRQEKHSLLSSVLVG